MIREVEPAEFLEQLTLFPVIDVRSPGEFSQGHIPGATNIPLFDDDERASVGTLYVQLGREDAIQKGLEFALPKTGFYIESLRAVRSTGEILLHCWRGGLRSASLAEVYSRAGYEVGILKGGYKVYRRFIRDAFTRPARIVVLGGYTGSGKTELLHAIASKGEQVVDLESIACHKGSVFGAFGQPAQPTNEQFENNLWERWSQLDLSRVIWIEDESRMIGRVTLPDPIVDLISGGALIRIELDFMNRVNRLVREYALFDEKLLTDAINRISDRLGGVKTREAIKALENNQFSEVAAITLSYYDKAYLYSISRRKSKNVYDLVLSGGNLETNAAQIIESAYKCLKHGTNLP
ncbi:MAG: tRNA 2-selenouridine(34) synthase MnmH [Bacteroidales bacterium]|nr:tRNA 2-selenouridine(34) synthase MnmH [Bacteroidales bacterium]